MARLPRLLIALAFLLMPLCGRAQVTILDGSQQNLVIVANNAIPSGSPTAWIMWRAKWIPEHMIFSFELPANFTAVNPKVECTLDDQSTNPNDATRWVQVALSEPQNGSYDVGGPSVGTPGLSATTILVETGVFPCVAWAIQTAGVGSFGSNNAKVTAVQLQSTGDAAFMSTVSAATPALLTSGGVRTQPGNAAGFPPINTPGPGNIVVTENLQQGPADFTLDSQISGMVRNNLPQMLAAAEFWVSGRGSPSTLQLFHPRICQNVYTATGIGAATVQLVPVPLLSGVTDRLCAAIFSNTNATATTVSIVAGTGVNCGTNQIVLMPPVTLSANTGSSPNFGFFFPVAVFTSSLNGAGFVADAICVTGSAAGSVNVMMIAEND